MSVYCRGIDFGEGDPGSTDASSGRVDAGVRLRIQQGLSVPASSSGIAAHWAVDDSSAELVIYGQPGMDWGTSRAAGDCPGIIVLERAMAA